MGPIVASDKDQTLGGSLPEHQKMVAYNGKEYDVVKEGLAEILNPAQTQKSNTTKGDSKSQTVFYNPIQQFNRDLSVLAIRVFGEDLAAIRRARADRSLQNVGKQEGKSKKRKRGVVDEKKALQDKTQGALSDTKEGQSQEPTTVTQNGSLVEGRDAAEPAAEEERSHSNGLAFAADAEATISTKKKRLEEPTKHPQEPVRAVHVQEPNKIPTEPAKMRTGGNTTHSKDFASDIPPFRILDALSATGLRALRYAKEIPSVTSVTANDLSPSAINSIKLNAIHNNISDKINPTTGDARVHMYSVLPHTGQQHGPYHVIDLDPYGTAAPFLDAAVHAVVDGGLLCVTCTDAGVFASTGYLEKTYSQYGGLPFKGPQSHEGGLRLILHAVATCAARYGKAVEPLLSLSIDFYARVFVRIRKSPAEVKFLASKTMIVYSCDEGCGAWTTQPLAQTREKKSRAAETYYKFSLAQGPSAGQYCEHCGFITHLAGPMWGGPLHNPYFVQRMLDVLPSLDAETCGTIPRMEGMLSVALSEFLYDTPQATPSDFEPPPPPIQPSHSPQPLQHHDPPILPHPIPRLPPQTRSSHPFFLIPSTLAKVLHTVCPPDAAIRGALLNLGYRTTRSHIKPGSIVTDAPWAVIWEIMREWVRQKSLVKEGKVRKGTAGWGIMRRGRVEGGGMEAGAGAEKEKPSETDTANAKPSRQPSPSSPPPSKRPTPPNPATLDIDFDEKLGKEAPSAKKIVRYQMNPRADWGPMNRAKGN